MGCYLQNSMVMKLYDLEIKRMGTELCTVQMRKGQSSMFYACSKGISFRLLTSFEILCPALYKPLCSCATNQFRLVFIALFIVAFWLIQISLSSQSEKSPNRTGKKLTSIGKNKIGQFGLFWSLLLCCWETCNSELIWGYSDVFSSAPNILLPIAVTALKLIIHYRGQGCCNHRQFIVAFEWYVIVR